MTDSMIFISLLIQSFSVALLSSLSLSLSLSITHTHTHTHTHTLFFFISHLQHSSLLVLLRLHQSSSLSFLTLCLHLHNQQCCWIQLLRLRAPVQWCYRQGHASRDLCRCCLLSKTQVSLHLPMPRCPPLFASILLLFPPPPFLPCVTLYSSLAH